MNTAMSRAGYGQAALPVAQAPASAAARLRRIQRVARLMDAAVRIPGTRRRIGLDGLLGLLPGVGDLATTAAAAYILREAKLLGVPNSTLIRMVANVGVDMAIGTIPLLGDLFDFAFKANLRNAELVEQHLKRASR